MMENPQPSIQIDLNEFKIHLHLKNKPQRTFHFDSPSRRFYLCVIALVVNEMKKSGKVRSIPLLHHLDLLALLNESVGGAAGSSDKENLLPRIYRKWKCALPNLEEAPLFKVLGKKKDEGEGAIGKVYSFTDAEKDDWANLFEYVGSDENVRLKFAMDKVGVSLNEMSIVFGDQLDGDAWDRFISSLKKGGKEIAEPREGNGEQPAVPPARPSEVIKSNKSSRLRSFFLVLFVTAPLIMTGVIAIWHFAFRPSPSEIAKTSKEEMTFSFPSKPSIAVLPFVNMSEDPRQEYFSDGITEDIITNLSKHSALTVVSRNSTFLYKGKTVKIEDVARDLGVRYVLEGSVRRAGGRVRITAQLIDSNTGKHLWADKYDRDLKDIFSVQDEVTRKVVSELAIALAATESDRLPRKHTESFEAYDLYLRAKLEQYIHKKENTLKGIEMCKRVTVLDPHFAGGYQLQSFLISRGIRFGWFPREDLKEAFKLAQKAISVDDRFPMSYMALASVYLMQGKQDDALAAANKAANIVPSDSDTIVWLGYYLHWVGHGEEAVAAVKKSRELNPMYLSCGYPVYLDFMGHACFQTGRYEDSIVSMKKSIELYGSSVSRDPYLIASFSMLGRMDEAKEAIRQWLKVNPSFSVSSWQFPRLYKRPEDSGRLYGALRKAGLK